MDRAHRVGVALEVGLELEYGATRLDTDGTETDQLRDGWQGHAVFENGQGICVEVHTLGGK